MKKTYCLFLAIVCLLSANTASAQAPQTEITFYTNFGEFVVRLEDKKAPITAGNFRNLVRAGFYDGIIFHRVINNFMIQGGDPTGTGSGGPGYTIADEFESSLSNIQKTISMANSGPNTGGSQFFINLVNNTHLDYNKPPLTSKHPVFGIVISGFTVVQDIGLTPVNSANRPNNDVVMDSLRISKDGALSIGEVENAFVNAVIYPNPVSAETSVSIMAKRDMQVNVSIFDQTGRNVYSAEKMLKTGANRITAEELQTSNLKQGIYFLRISGENAFTQQKFIQLR